MTPPSPEGQRIIEGAFPDKTFSDATLAYPAGQSTGALDELSKLGGDGSIPGMVVNTTPINPDVAKDIYSLAPATQNQNNLAPGYSNYNGPATGFGNPAANFYDPMKPTLSQSPTVSAPGPADMFLASLNESTSDGGKLSSSPDAISRALRSAAETEAVALQSKISDIIGPAQAQYEMTVIGLSVIFRKESRVRTFGT
jgi:hypothetical protein